ncbi:hypothetical protein [Fischerella sp. PCC 9605]|uniref:hypothetical protein n=1 Tax=Fischerella sp. PCC 9605 TaxID=1173024 RepID=UPI001E40690F|nr:hypothetical protein [Fischerella sp. PCC 9605]
MQIFSTVLVEVTWLYQQVSPGALVKNPSVLVIAYLRQIVKYRVTAIGDVGEVL